MFKSIIKKLAIATVVAVAPVTVSINAHALGGCVTRSLSASYSGSSWMSKTICNAGEVAVSAGGFCDGAGTMKGVSTTTGTADRLVWLWCSQNGSAYWYAMCCTP